MSNENISIHDFDFNLICEYFTNLERQGPGSPEVTLKALSFIEPLTDTARIADIGCGTGGQTMTLAQHCPGQITGIDLFPLRGIERNEVYVTDMVGTPVFDASQTFYGFVNRTAYLDGPNLYPLFRGVRGPDQGFESRGIEGILYRNFLSTWAMGPALVRNPFLMKEVLRRTLGENYQDDLDFSLEEQAHDLVVEEMRHGR